VKLGTKLKAVLKENARLKADLGHGRRLQDQLLAENEKLAGEKKVWRSQQLCNWIY
jgi:hypothetical protein